MDNSGIRLNHFLRNENITQKEVALNMGCASSYVNALCKGKKPIGKQTASKLQELYGVNAGWLLTGEGTMYARQYNDDTHSPALHEDQGRYAAVSQRPPSPSRPYFAVDFAASFDIMENDQTTTPSFLVDFPPYRSCDCYCNVYGDSMFPTISSGDIVAIKRIEDFRYLINGKIYGIITTNGLRTIKRIRDNGDTFTLIADNPAVTDQTIPKNLITHVFAILGSIKHF